eukprot:1004707-Heterocapsa_arctica.AAC.1
MQSPARGAPSNTSRPSVSALSGGRAKYSPNSFSTRSLWKQSFTSTLLVYIVCSAPRSSLPNTSGVASDTPGGALNR